MRTRWLLAPLLLGLVLLFGQIAPALAAGEREAPSPPAQPGHHGGYREPGHHRGGYHDRDHHDHHDHGHHDRDRHER